MSTFQGCTNKVMYTQDPFFITYHAIEQWRKRAGTKTILYGDTLKALIYMQIMQNDFQKQKVSNYI